MEDVLLTISLLSFFLWTGLALTQGKNRTSLGKIFRGLMLLLSLFFLLYTTGFELTRQWPILTIRPPTFYLTVPHILDSRQVDLPFSSQSFFDLFQDF